MDPTVLKVVGRNLMDTWDNLPTVIKNKGDQFLAQDAQGKVDTLLRFGIETVALGAVEKVGSFAVKSTVGGIKSVVGDALRAVNVIEGLDKSPVLADFARRKGCQYTFPTSCLISRAWTQKQLLDLLVC